MFPRQYDEMTMSQRLEVTPEEIDYELDYFNIDPISEQEDE